MKSKIIKSLLFCVPLVSSHSMAEMFEDFDVSFSGFVRAEAAISTSGQENPNNQGGILQNDQSISRQAYLPPALNPVSGVGALLGLGGAGAWGSTPLPFNDTVRRGDFVEITDNDLNYAVIRTEIEMNMQFNYEWRFIARMRAMFDPEVYDAFDASSLSSYQGGLDAGPHAAPELYESTPSYFDYLADEGGNPNPLEWAGRNYQVYFPTFLLEYASGDLSMRLGNQQIAWGQAIFFRVFDTPNGLDLRRHSILDMGLEEFSDKRVPMLSLRTTYQLSSNVLVDGYIGRFQPSVFGNPNTPYNIIPSQFTIHDTYESGGYDDKLAGGIRLKGDYGQWGWQASFVSRYAPEGTFAWTKSGVNKPLTGFVGGVINTAYNAKLPANSVACPVYTAALCRRYANSGEAMANTPFSVNPGGVYTADEWFQSAADSRLDAIGGLNAAIEEFEASRDVYATPGATVEETVAQLNTFFMAAGGSLRGHLERTYHRENDFAVGASYVVDSENNFLNQLIFNLEIQYTPERTFTNPTLSQDEIKEDEYTVALVVDKWHRFFDDLPGTYSAYQE
ncbi:DUF1302 family protein [Spongiibacter marinus]|uniref:DUF1302 family protein n=1 Tax=Spongiibacter marinus TaxID=354246 RepID=UPI0003F67093|nr:DUF1302 family protein [Spongiibacter marinus]